MIVENLEEIKNNLYPVIIIGSGPAGISLALKLEEKKINCLIIEAGKEKYDHDSQGFYEGVVVGDSISNLKHSRLRQLGGTSGHWGGWCKPMDRFNIKTWGLSFDELSKYSKDTCNILGLTNNFDKAELNDYFNQIQFQYSTVRFAKKFKNIIQKSKYINLVTMAHATHFIGSNGVVDSVFVKFNKKDYILKSKLFVLGCGGVENSRVLLWTKELNNDLINKKMPIGNYWMTHPWIIGGIGVIKKSKLQKLLKDKFINYDGPLHIATSKNIILDKNILSGAIYMNAKEDTLLHKEIIKDLLCTSPKYGKKIARLLFDKNLKCGNIFMNLEEDAKKSNKITLHEKIKDKNGIPISKVFYKKSNKSLLSAKVIMEELGKFLINKNIGRIAIKKEIDNLEGFNSLGAHHHMGGTRVGTEVNSSVVDTDLKVHGTKNLFVAGSSVFRSSGYSNPTYTIVQLSLRLSDEIKKKLS
jgi:hypothetical protein